MIIYKGYRLIRFCGAIYELLNETCCYLARNLKEAISLIDSYNESYEERYWK